MASRTRRIMSALGVVLLVCAGVRLAYWLVNPLWPLLAVLGCLTVIGMVVSRRQ